MQKRMTYIIDNNSENGSGSNETFLGFKLNNRPCETSAYVNRIGSVIEKLTNKFLRNAILFFMNSDR